MVVQCDVGDQPTDAATVDALGRAHLNALRGGDRIVLLNASAELLGLIDLMGLGAVLVSA
ncbi:MAG TPA: hypothetical protein VIL94_04890 [Acidothermaceae bacterium]